MKIPFFKKKSKHTRIFSAISVAVILLLSLLNVLFAHLGLYNLAYVDMTPEGFYTLSDKMEEFCKGVLEPEGADKKDITITFCADPDTLVGDTEMRVTYFMALALAKKFDSVSVIEENIKYNPTAVSAYKTTSRQNIESSDVIVSYGSKYRVIEGKSFWTFNGDGTRFSYNGEYKMASALASLTAINAPKAYFVTDLGGAYYNPDMPDSTESIASAVFADLLIERGMEIRNLKLSEVDKIPEDCALLIINNPERDLKTVPDNYATISYISDAEKIDRYLINNLGSLIVNKAYDKSFPVLESLLSEWGISFGNGMVKDEQREYSSPTDNDYNLLAVYDTSDESFGKIFYSDYAGLSSAPDMLFKNSGYVYCSFNDGHVKQEPGTFNTNKRYASFIGTTLNAIATSSINSTTITCDKGYKALACASARTSLDSTSGETSYSYVFASNSEYFYSNEVLGNASFANYDILASLISNISRTDRYASIELGGISMNSTSFGGKQTVNMILKESQENVYSWDGATIVKVNRAFTPTARGWFTAIVCVAPVSALILGFVVFVRRKFL